jgi:hypothetical protein
MARIELWSETLAPDVACVYCWYVLTASMGCSKVLTHAADSAEASADLHPSIQAEEGFCCCATLLTLPRILRSPGPANDAVAAVKEEEDDDDERAVVVLVLAGATTPGGDVTAAAWQEALIAISTTHR